MAHHRSLAFHPNTQVYATGDDRDYSPPDEDSRSGREEKKPRKRNSVACARCRKRKIKCTGDLSDGNGCEACQAAGTNSNSCFYLRVNSHQLNEFPLQSPPEPDWPYAGPASIPRITTDPGQYALANGNVLSSSTASPYTLQTGRAHTQPFNDYTASTPRQSFPTTYQSSMDTISPQYGSRYGVPLTVSQAPMATYSAGEYSQDWTPLSLNSRPISNNFAFETDPSNYQSSALPYMQANGLAYPGGATEQSSIFPGLSPLASNLPYSGPNRTLPNPVSVQTVGSAVQDHGNTSEPSSSNGSSSPTDTHQSSNPGYGNLRYSSHFGSNASGSTLPSGGVSRRMSNEENFPTAASGIQLNQANLSSSYGLQSVPGGFNLQDEPVNPVLAGRSMLGGQSDIHHPQPQQATIHEPPILRGTFDPKPQETRKSSSSKSKGYKSYGAR